MKLTRANKDEIVKSVMSEFHDEFNALQLRATELTEILYSKVVSDSDRKLAEKLPHNMVYRRAALNISRLYYRPTKDLPVELQITTRLPEKRPFPEGYYSETLDKFPENRKEVASLRKDNIAFADKCLLVQRELEMLLSKIRTTDALVKAWPDGVKHISNLSHPSPSIVKATGLIKALKS